jgi:Flp pilus assembly protein TadD
MAYILKAHNNLGAMLWRAGDKAGAIRCHEAALAINPNYAAARRNMEIAKGGRWQFHIGPPD